MGNKIITNDCHRIRSYQELEALADNKENVIFGAGAYGSTWGYYILNAAGIHISCYYDNKVPVGEMRNSIRVENINKLYEYNDAVRVFVAINYRKQQEVEKQLLEHDIYNYYFVDAIFIQDIINSILESGDKEVLDRYKEIVDDEEFLKIQYKYNMRATLDLDNPRTYNEKLQWLKLHDRNPEYTRMVDKFEFKKYIAEKIGEGYTIPTLGVWEKFDDINFDDLPDQFVLKCTHDSGSVMIIKDKTKFDKEFAKKRFDYLMQLNYFWGGREWPYKNILPRIIAEPYMEDVYNGELRDYKFFAFMGEVKGLFVATERQKKGSEVKFDFYDADFNHLPFKQGHENSNSKIEKPRHFEKMKKLAEIISKDLREIRVDFYEVNGEIYIGELTFFHFCGWVKFEPYDWDYEFGSYIRI